MFIHATTCCPETVNISVTFCHRTGTYRVRAQANPAQMELFSDSLGDVEVTTTNPDEIPALVRGVTGVTYRRFIRAMRRGYVEPPHLPGEAPAAPR